MCDLLRRTDELELRKLAQHCPLDAMCVPAVCEISVADGVKIGVLEFKDTLFLGLLGTMLLDDLLALLAYGRGHVCAERLLKPFVTECGIEFPHGERVTVVVFVGHVHAPIAELSVYAPTLKQLAVFIDGLRLFGSIPA